MAVIDANVAVALIVDLPWSKEARERIRLDDAPIAPAILLTEIANALWQQVRKQVLTLDDALAGLSDVRRLITITRDEDSLEDALRLAVSANHPVYDCVYLALASQSRTSLLTADRKLAAIARERGIPCRLLL
ncbi:hypothetical protein K32_27130 [Kaistia sp. 32K]|uniref:type II toxin-antitoxin system VapC family toxin n=1 Tax=Kaistia sp. 32K TaxID=2795690 RepID=UPI0019159CE6|nr:type II toxin-antitoxin system VapC family toxin [Kaistia sp. 32K]BCP54096.1 hypothetical protein K32_27130 [Kaistia sp. 32K]